MFLDVCVEPEVQRIALLDAPSVLGWDAWRQVEARHGLGLIRLALQNLIDEGTIEAQPVEPLAHAILGTLIEAGLYVARADQWMRRGLRWGRCCAGCWRGFARRADGGAGQPSPNRAASSEPPVASPAL